MTSTIGYRQGRSGKKKNTFIFLSASTYTVAIETLPFDPVFTEWPTVRRLPYLFVFGAHLGHQHGHVVGVPHPGVAGEVLQDHHGLVKASDRLHHPEVNKQPRQSGSERRDGAEGDGDDEVRSPRKRHAGKRGATGHAEKERGEERWRGLALRGDSRD